MNYSDWHIPISEENISLRTARESLKQIGAKKEDIPLIIRLVENPAYSLPGFTLFHGAVDLKSHDYIHILLGRGLLPEDEAFTIGYTMGSTHQVNQLEATLFELVTRHLYPQTYRFRERDIEIFYSALKLARSSNVVALDQFNYANLLDVKLKLARTTLGISKNKIMAYFNTEKTLYPDSKSSTRLLD